MLCLGILHIYSSYINIDSSVDSPLATFHSWPSVCKPSNQAGISIPQFRTFHVRPPSTSRSSGGGGEVLWGDFRHVGLSNKLWTHGGNLLNGEIRINSEISEWGVKLEWPDFESSKYSLIHICYMCGYVWFKRRTYTKIGFPGSKRSIMMNLYMNLPLCKPQGHYNLYRDQKKGWSRETWKSPRSCAAKKDWARPKDSGKGCVTLLVL